MYKDPKRVGDYEVVDQMSQHKEFRPRFRLNDKPPMMPVDLGTARLSPRSDLAFD